MPLRALMDALVREADAAGAVSGGPSWLDHVVPYLTNNRDHRRIDLQLRAYVCPWSNSPRPWTVEFLNGALQAALQALRAGELGPELKRSMACINRYVTPHAASLHEGTRRAVVEAMAADFPSHGPEDDLLRICCLPAARFYLRRQGPAGRIPYSELREAVHALDRLQGTILVRDIHTMPLNGRGGLQFRRPHEPLEFFGPFSDFVLTLHVLAGIQGIMDALFGPVQQINELQPVEVNELFRMALRVQRRSLNTLRALRNLTLPQAGDLNPAISLDLLEAGMLALQAQLERACGEFRAAVPTAIAALMKAPVKAQDHPACAHFRSLLDFLGEQGVLNKRSLEQVRVPTDGFDRLRERLGLRLSELSKALEDVKRCYPALAVPALSTQLQIGASLATHARHDLHPGGWGSSKAQRIRRYETDPELRAAAVLLAVRTGSLNTAASFFIVGDEGDEFAREHRSATALRLGADGLAALASEFAVASQRGALWMDTRSLNRFKNAVRKMMRPCPLDLLSNPGDILFINHLRVELNYRFRPLKAIQGDSDDEIVRLAQGPSHIKPLSMESFRNARLRMDPRSMLVSLTNRDGDSVAVTFVTPGANGHFDVSGPFERKAKVDWVELLERLLSSVQVDAHGSLDIEVDGAIIDLTQYILQECVRRNPGVQRILLHAEPMWNTVPWQHLLNSYLDGDGRNLLADYVGKGLRNAGDNLIAVWRIPGVRTEESVPAAHLQERHFAIDRTEPGFVDIELDLGQRLGTQHKPAKGFLSILAHGQVNADSAAARFVFDGVEISGEALARRYPGFPLVCLHVCNAAQLGDYRFGRDDSALPNAFFNAGASCVIAPGLALPLEPELIQKLEHYMASVTDVTNLGQVEDAYLNACRESKQVALYGLYSNTMAPLLIPKEEK